jgi:hypothetical protein
VAVRCHDPSVLRVSSVPGLSPAGAFGAASALPGMSRTEARKVPSRPSADGVQLGKEMPVAVEGHLDAVVTEAGLDSLRVGASEPPWATTTERWFRSLSPSLA